MVLISIGSALPPGVRSTVIACCVFVSWLSFGCATQRLVIEVAQPEAVLSEVNASSGQREGELGRGGAILDGEQVEGKAILITLEGHETMLLYVPSGVDDEKLRISLQEKGARDEDSLEALRLQLEMARKAALNSEEKLRTQRDYFEKLVEPLSRTQHFLTLQSPSDAQRMIEEVEKLGNDEFRPAYALVIQAKVMVALGRPEDAKVLLEKALSQNPNHPEARRILEALNGP